MHTRLVSIDLTQALAPQLAAAGLILQQGGLVAMPTETVYGLAANALDPAAVDRIYTAKGRPANNPLIVHVATIKQAQSLVAEWPAAAAQLAERFWPGPLTMVLPKSDLVPAITTAGASTVAVRIPQHPVALALIEHSGLALAAPSANRSNRLSPTTAQHVAADLDGRIELILDAGPTTAGIESTVVDLSTSPPQLLRPGSVSFEELRTLLPDLVWGEHLLAKVATNRLDERASLPAPGMLTRHYAPRTPLECRTKITDRVSELLATGVRCGVLAMTNPLGSATTTELVFRPMSSNPAEYASQMYAVLHEFDQLGLQRVILELPPNLPVWVAVRDRLRRAATDWQE